MPEQVYKVTQEAGTDIPFRHPLMSFQKRDLCGCNPVSRCFLRGTNSMRTADGRFLKPILQQNVDYVADDSHGMKRIEVVSHIAESHLGHVFTDGPSEAGGLRYCINGSALRFIPKEKMVELGYSELLPFV